MTNDERRQGLERSSSVCCTSSFVIRHSSFPHEGGDMATSGSPGQRLRDAWAAATVQVPGVFSPLVARVAERLGFQAVYLSGAALSASLGLPDVGLVRVSEFA